MLAMEARCATSRAQLLELPPDHTLPVRRLRSNICALIEAYPAADLVGPDPRVEDILEAHMIGKNEVAVVRAIVGTKRVTIVGILTDLWHSDPAHFQLCMAREEAARQGIRVVFLHERFCRRQPRLSNARIVADASGTPVTPEDRLSVLRHLVSNGPSTLHDCACRVSSPVPYTTVLAMAAAGVVDINLNARVEPDTTVDLPLRRAA